MDSDRQNPKSYAGGKIEKGHRGDPGFGPVWAGKASDADAPGWAWDPLGPFGPVGPGTRWARLAQLGLGPVGPVGPIT